MSVDINMLRTLLEQGTQKQRGLIKGAYEKTPELSQKFGAKMGELGTGFVTGSEQRAKQFGTQLTGLESPEMVRQRQAKATELAFRNLPQAQQMIRENLAATGGLGRGAAVRALQQPVMQASQQAADEAFRIQQAADERGIARQELAISNLFETGQGAALEKLGIDKDTATMLLKTGRADILDRAIKLAGIESAYTQGLMDIEVMRGQQEAARKAAKRKRRAAITSSIGTLAGGGIGAFAGGPMGAMMGSQLGGQLGGLASGGTQPLDLSGMLALIALTQNPAASRRIGLTRTRSTPTSSNFSTLFPGGR